MKTAHSIITASCLALLATPAIAETPKPAGAANQPATTSSQPAATRPATTSSTQPGTTGANPASAATEQSQLFNSHALKDKKVFDKQGGEVGQFEGILFDSQSGRARYGIIELNKTWQLNDPEVIVPWGAFQVTKRNATEYEIKLDTTKEKVQKAPKFDPNNLDQLATREKGQPIYAYWAIIWVDDEVVAPLATQSTTPGIPGTSTKPATNSQATSSSAADKPGTTPSRNTGAETKPAEQ